MFIFTVYDSFGTPTNTIQINDEVNFVGGRVYRGKKCYYKGIGTKYSHQFTDKAYGQIDLNEYNVLGKSEVLYLTYEIEKKCFVGKEGVFAELYQPFYPDFIGSCSVKEGKIVINSFTFEKSSVEIFECVEFDKDNQQYYYKLDYKCGRKNYCTDNGSPAKLKELIDFMIVNDWNFLWDKGAISDITNDGRVSDVGDLFQSSELTHKLGTVYSVLYSLGKLHPEKYIEFLNYINLKHSSDISFIFNSVMILKQNGIDIAPLLPHKEGYDNYKHIVTNYLLTGKNCGYCACDLFIDQGDKIRNKYLDTVKFS